ncbi:phytase [Shewanella salipaludis]|uniref:Phytase n=1 Tax=Shewanella salipaludis TaxID=2723052 RepID=A0A972JK58_9GAMM|nr:phytase [Shewanella salipaludis]NMH64012.1 phytase [Shewanella salipaludis]
MKNNSKRARVTRVAAISVLWLLSAGLGAAEQQVVAIDAHKGSQAQALTRPQEADAASHGGADNKMPARWLLASERLGLVLQAIPESGSSLPGARVLVEGEFSLLAFAAPYALTLDKQADRIRPIYLRDQDGTVTSNLLPLLPMLAFEINWICIQPRRQDGYFYAWFGSETGQSEQWLLGDATHLSPRLMRRQAIPVDSSDCAIDGDNLYVSEPNAGVWQYDASPFANNGAKLVLPAIDNRITGLAVVNGELITSDKQANIGRLEARRSLNTSLQAGKAEHLSISVSGAKHGEHTLGLMVFDDKSDRYLFRRQGMPESDVKPRDTITEIPAWVESAPADRPGDTMDDPAIWVHPSVPEKSLILGTNKQWGLLSFNMQGKQMQALASGRINNIDLRQQVRLGGKLRDIAVATQRERNSLAFYEIDALGDSAGKISEFPNQATDLVDIYGLCLYRGADALYVFANEKSGRIAQYRVGWQDQAPNITLVRNISAPSQVEGCVVDESQRALFIGEEDKGIWRFDAEATGSARGELVIKAGGDLVPDVEGISLYPGARIKGQAQDLLVVSSQGNNSYLLYQSTPPYTQVGRFRIGINPHGLSPDAGNNGIDGSAETDGLAVTHLPVGSGPWQQGMLVVQDGYNYMPDANQSFKWLPWSSIGEQLSLNDK